MSLELLSKLETKIQAALETIELQKMELDEVKQSTGQLEEQSRQLSEQNEQLKNENQQLQQDLNSWNEKVTGLVGLLNNEVE